MALFGKIFEAILGYPFGRVYPDRPVAELPAVEPRVIALRVLRRYIASLPFVRPNRGGRPLAYPVPIENILIDRPPSPRDLVLPSIVFLPGESEYLSLGLTAYVDEASRDKVGKGTALQEQNEYRELVVVQVWAEQLPERRAIMAGLETALVPTEQMYGVRMRMADYFDQTVCFSLWSGERTDDPGAVKNRRWGQLLVEMRFNMVALVNANELNPSVAVDAYDDPATIPIGVSLPSRGAGSVGGTEG